jgi:hypothetical protein
MEPKLWQKLAKKEITKKQLLQAVESNFTLLPIVIDGVSSPKASVRYTCASVLMTLIEKHPEKLYPNLDFFKSLLNSKHRILIWNGMATLANLCAVDVDEKFDEIFDRYYGFLNDEYMVTVANVVANSARIARAKPYLVPRITARLLSVSEISTSPHLTEECTKVIAEKAVESFNEFFDLMDVTDKAKVATFVRGYAESSRAQLREKAQLFLKQRNL